MNNDNVKEREEDEAILKYIHNGLPWRWTKCDKVFICQEDYFKNICPDIEKYKSRDEPKSKKQNMYKVVKEIRIFGEGVHSDVHLKFFNTFHPVGAIICVPYFEETKVYQDNKDCFELYEVKDLYEHYKVKKLYEHSHSDKIQMTEAQFDKFWNDCNLTRNSFEIKLWKQKARDEGYIIKSDLQTLAEEADNIYVSFQQYKYTSDQNILSNDDKNLAWVHNACKVMSKQYETIEALKKDHPEFKK